MTDPQVRLAIELLQHAMTADDAAGLDRAIGMLTSVIGMTESGHPDLPRRLNSLSMALLTRYERHGQIADLDTAISTVQRAANVVPRDVSARRMYLSNLAAALQTRFHASGDPADVDRALAAGTEAAGLLQPGDPLTTLVQGHLSLVYFARYSVTGDQSDLDSAIHAGQLTVSHAASDSEVWQCLSGLTGIWLARFRATQRLADVDEAVECGRRAVAACPPRAPERAAVMLNVARTLGERFEQSQDRADLDRSIAMAREARAACVPGFRYERLIAFHLGQLLTTRFGVTREQADIDEAIETLRSAVVLARDDRGPAEQSVFALVVALNERYEFRRFGDAAAVDDLDEAIALSTAAAEHDIEQTFTGITAVLQEQRKRAVMTERLYASVLRRIEDSAGDDARVLDDEGVAEADTLWMLWAGGDTMPAPVVRLVAWFKWARWGAAPDDNLDDLAEAHHLYSMLAQIDARMYPDELRQHVAEHRPDLLAS